MFLCWVLSMSAANLNRYALSIVLVCSVLSLSARQNQYPVLASADSAEVWFDKLVNTASAAIVNGPEYRVAFQGTRSHPFFLSAESDRTYVHYDHDTYRNVDLLYDSYGDILVYKFVAPDKVLFIKLDTKLVEHFDLHKHHFKKYEEGVRAGIGAYFDVLFEQKEFAVVVKRRKLERLDGKRSDYIEDDVHYILDNGQWTRITGSRSFAKAIPKSQRKELATFIKNNHINVRKRKDDDLKKLGAFCYSLKGNK